ncbi:MAG: hypothetical protein EBX40_03785, partial [Gammaproteobacteria bacterium]|nr:hypothetical protein [Gammaproteobacteria bacterium]
MAAHPHLPASSSSPASGRLTSEVVVNQAVLETYKLTTPDAKPSDEPVLTVRLRTTEATAEESDVCVNVNYTGSTFFQNYLMQKAVYESLSRQPMLVVQKYLGFVLRDLWLNPFQAAKQVLDFYLFNAESPKEPRTTPLLTKNTRAFLNEFPNFGQSNILENAQKFSNPEMELLESLRVGMLDDAYGRALAARNLILGAKQYLYTLQSGVAHWRSANAYAEAAIHLLAPLVDKFKSDTSAEVSAKDWYYPGFKEDCIFLLSRAWLLVAHASLEASSSLRADADAFIGFSPSSRPDCFDKASFALQESLKLDPSLEERLPLVVVGNKNLEDLAFDRPHVQKIFAEEIEIFFYGFLKAQIKPVPEYYVRFVQDFEKRFAEIIPEHQKKIENLIRFICQEYQFAYARWIDIAASFLMASAEPTESVVWKGDQINLFRESLAQVYRNGAISEEELFRHCTQASFVETPNRERPFYDIDRPSKTLKLRSTETLNGLYGGSGNVVLFAERILACFLRDETTEVPYKTYIDWLYQAACRSVEAPCRIELKILKILADHIKTVVPAKFSKLLPVKKILTLYPEGWERAPVALTRVIPRAFLEISDRAIISFSHQSIAEFQRRSHLGENFFVFQQYFLAFAGTGIRVLFSTQETLKDYFESAYEKMYCATSAPPHSGPQSLVTHKFTHEQLIKRFVDSFEKKGEGLCFEEILRTNASAGRRLPVLEEGDLCNVRPAAADIRLFIETMLSILEKGKYASKTIASVLAFIGFALAAPKMEYDLIMGDRPQELMSRIIKLAIKVYGQDRQFYLTLVNVLNPNFGYRQIPEQFFPVPIKGVSNSALLNFFVLFLPRCIHLDTNELESHITMAINVLLDAGRTDLLYIPGAFGKFLDEEPEKMGGGWKKFVATQIGSCLDSYIKSAVQKEGCWEVLKDLCQGLSKGDVL